MKALPSVSPLFVEYYYGLLDFLNSICYNLSYLYSFWCSNFKWFDQCGASLIAQLVKNLPAVRETWLWSLGWEDPLEKGKATHSSILAWRIPWTLYSPWGHKEWDTTDLLSLSPWPGGAHRAGFCIFGQVSITFWALQCRISQTLYIPRLYLESTVSPRSFVFFWSKIVFWNQILSLVLFIAVGLFLPAYFNGELGMEIVKNMMSTQGFFPFKFIPGILYLLIFPYLFHFSLIVRTLIPNTSFYLGLGSCVI